MGTALASGEDSIINTSLDVLRIGVISPEENEPSARSTKGLVGGSCDDIAVLEGVVQFLGGHKTASVSDIGHEPCIVLVANFLESSVIPVARIGRGTANDKPGLE